MNGFRGRPAITLFLVAVAITFVGFVAGDVPVLRHDWFPIVAGFRYVIGNVAGWDPTGLGSPIAFPASFLAVFARSMLAAVFGPLVAHVLFFSTIAVLAAFGAARLADVLDAPVTARMGLACVATFNPWTYVEVVAGHSFMLLSYAATFWLIAEACSRVRRPERLVLLALAVAPQIQFLVIDAVVYVALAIRMRSTLVATAIAAMLLPVAVGITLGRHSLLSFPITLAWEQGQSIFPFEGVLLRGYFTHYDRSLPAFYDWSMYVIVGCAAAGVVTIGARRRRLWWLVPFAAVPLLWAFGSRGPLDVVFAAAIEHVPESGLFRELYDLLGYVAIGYVAFCAIFAARARFAGPILLVAGVALVMGWTLAPPARLWVGSSRLPHTNVPTTPNVRFALLPAFGPLHFGDRGSGTDPDLYPRGDDVTPINEVLPTFPVAPAFGRYQRDGDASGLAALSVRSIVERPWLQTDRGLGGAFALPLPTGFTTGRRPSRTLANVLSELTLGPLPSLATLGSNLRASSVLVGDAAQIRGSDVPPEWRRAPRVTATVSDDTFVHASDGWVDARLAFAESPELAQSYGGALTTSGSATLGVGSGAALVYVRGRLFDRRDRTLLVGSGGYRWIEVPKDAGPLRCGGLCVVAASASSVPTQPLDARVAPVRDVAFTAMLPWYVVARVPPGDEPFVRWNVTFDPSWRAFEDGRELTHVEIDGAVNGWLLPPRQHAATLTLVEMSALLTTLAEGTAAFGYLVLLAIAFRTVGKRAGSRSIADADARLKA